MTSLHRSMSLGSVSSGKISEASTMVEEDHSEAGDVLTELQSPPSGPDLTPTATAPPWMRELMNSGINRNSRASSVVSTRTRFSTTTWDDARADARSVDIHVGGQYFRISRDGSRITDAPPPPYSGPVDALRNSSPDPLASRSSRASSFQGGRSRASSVFDAQYGEHEDENEIGRITTAVHNSPVNLRANILDPTEVDMPSPVDSATHQVQLDAGLDTPGRNRSYKAGPEVITVARDARKQRAVSENNMSVLGDFVQRLSSPLRRRPGIRLPSLVTESLNERVSGACSQPATFHARRSATAPTRIRSAGPVLETTVEGGIPESPTFIGRNAEAVFPRPELWGAPPYIYNLAETSTTSVLHNPSIDTGEEDGAPLAMDNENDISLHYARLMRRLDRDHRRALHLKDKELEKLRERLNEMDTVYRQELRSRDFMIEDLKKRLDHLQETQEDQIEKARNGVEDLWESRWKDRDFHLRERMRRIEEDARRNIAHVRAVKGGRSPVDETPFRVLDGMNA